MGLALHDFSGSAVGLTLLADAAAGRKAKARTAPSSLALKSPRATGGFGPYSPREPSRRKSAVIVMLALQISRGSGSKWCNNEI